MFATGSGTAAAVSTDAAGNRAAASTYASVGNAVNLVVEEDPEPPIDLDDPAILSTKVRAHAGVNDLEGTGVIEAPRGTLFHHYRVAANDLVTMCNLMVSTTSNNEAMNRAVGWVA